MASISDGLLTMGFLYFAQIRNASSFVQLSV